MTETANPSPWGVTPVEAFKLLAATIPEEPHSNGGKQRSYTNAQFDLPKWIADNNLDVIGPHPWNGGQKWIFRVCPWNSDHTNRSAYIIQFANRAMAAGCHHNGCAGKGWRELRELFEPGEREHYDRANRDGETANPCLIDEDRTDDPIKTTLEACGLSALESGASMTAVENALRDLASNLAGSDDLRHATIREATIKKLEALKISAPARLVDAAIGREKTESDGQLQGKPLVLADVEPWSEPVDGAELLKDLCRAIRRYVVMETWEVVATALWCVHAHVIDAFAISPFLNLSSPEKGCGKSTTLSVISILLPRSVLSGNMSPSSIFRAIEKYKPSFLIDEADSFENLNEELRGLLNASHLRASAQTIRNVGDEHEPRLFSTWCPKAVALIGRLPDTLEDRSVVIQMRRRKKGENYERFSALRPHPELEQLAQKAARWTKDHFDTLRQAEPSAPEGIDLRVYDNWLPLLAIADAAGGKWPRWARLAAQGFIEKGREDSIKVELLKDVRQAVGGLDKISSEDLVEALNKMVDRPWPTWGKHGKPINQSQIARILKGFGIKSKTIRIGDKTPKGYPAEAFKDAFERYLAHDATFEETTFEAQQAQQTNIIRDLSHIFDPQQNANVAHTNNALSTDKDDDVALVADRKHESSRRYLCDQSQDGEGVDEDGFNWQTGEQEHNPDRVEKEIGDGFEDVPK